MKLSHLILVWGSMIKKLRGIVQFNNKMEELNLIEITWLHHLK